MFLNFCLYILCFATAYILGSFNFAIFISKNFYNKNIKKLGSKNAGATNMLVNFGKAPAIATLLGDILKGFIAVLICKILCSKIANSDNIILIEYIVLFFALVGHIFPIFYKFKGGKGIAVTAGAMIFIDLKVFLTLVTIFIIIFKFSKIVSLSSLSATVCYPIVTFIFNYFINYKVSTKITLLSTIISLIVSIIIILAHKENIKRLIENRETKIKK